MKKILLILCLFPILVFSQKSYKIPADSTILNNIGSGKNELVIRNATSNITGGVLTNLGNGVTAFVLGGGSARVVDTIYKNNTKDSIVFTISGIRYAVKDSFNLNTDSQTLSISNDTLTISGGNSVVLPVYVQADSSTINSYDVLNSQNTPPVSPSTGDVYLVGNVPTGAWVGHAKDIAEWNGSAWVFTDGVQGDFLYNSTTALTYIFRSGNWVQTTGIPALNNGNTISSGLIIGTNNARSLTFETNNVNRGRFDSVGRFHVYNLPTASTGDTFVTKSDLGGKLTKVGQSTFLSGGAFIPLIGTVSGSPVTGDLVFFDGANTANFTLSFSDGLQIYNDKNTNVFSIDGTNSTSTGIILQSDKDGVLDIGSSNVSSRGIVSANDYSANITDLDYTQKIYVDNAISSNRKVDTSYIFRNATLDSTCMITVINGITYRSCAFDSGSGGGGGDLATLIDDCQNVDAETIDGFETFPILKNDTVYQLSLGTFAELIGGGGGGISDAPSDGQLYGRQNNDWSVFPDAELPSTDHYEFFADTLCEGICREYVGIKRKGSYSSARTDFGFVSTYNSLSNFGYVFMGAANSFVVVDDNDDVQINAQGKLRLLTPNYNTSSNGSVLTLIDSMNGECEWKPQYATVPISASDTGVKGQMAVDATYLYICVDTDTWTRVALAW